MKTMLDASSFMKNSPFKQIHGESNFSLSNTTPELLKFQLQEQFRTIENTNCNKLEKEPLMEVEFEPDTFNGYLQSRLDAGNTSIIDSIPSLCSSPSILMESDIDETILKSSLKPSYLNLKVLIEHLIFDISKIKKDSVLSLLAIYKLKDAIAEKEELKSYLDSKMTISQECIDNLLNRKDETERIDSQLLLRILKLNSNLQKEYSQVSMDLENLKSNLNNHNLSCLVMGYVEDIKLASNSTYNLTPESSPNGNIKNINTQKQTIDTVEKSLENLFSHIASIAVQKNVTLPSPPTTLLTPTIDEKMKWAEYCIDAIVQNNITKDDGIFTANTTTSSVQNNEGDISKISVDPNDSFINSFSTIPISPTRLKDMDSKDKVILEYKTALNDLRFSYQYLTKEFEHSRESSTKMIKAIRKKNALLEKEIEMSKDSSCNHESITCKDKEISKLRKELDIMKVNTIGKKDSLNSSSPTSSSFIQVDQEPLEETREVKLSQNTPNLQVDESFNDSYVMPSPISTSRPISYYSNGGTSNGILREEFKKIVNEIHDLYEIQINEERIRRQKLQDELDQLKAQI